jgi:cardiolipin synthase
MRDAPVRCLIQPGDSIQPLIQAISAAKKSIEIAIFRFDRREIERALAAAVARGVRVRALIAYTNRGGEKSLRELEMRLLAVGVTVARTDNDLVRYHGKLMIVDRRQLFLLAFNFTYLDIEHSRSFGVITTNRRHVQEAVKLFEADTQRQPYSPGSATFIVSPVNARQQLSAFVKGAKKELLIYDPEVADRDIIRLLEERAAAGVTVKIIGRLTGDSASLKARRMTQMRLHTRSIVRDGRDAFIGSQSLRPLELDARREVGIIFRDPKTVKLLADTFQSDWASTESPAAGHRVPDEPAGETLPAASVAKRVAKAMARGLGRVTPVVEMTVREVAGAEAEVTLNSVEVETTVKDAVKKAVKEAVKDLVEGAVAIQSEPRTEIRPSPRYVGHAATPARAQVDVLAQAKDYYVIIKPQRRRLEFANEPILVARKRDGEPPV